MTPKIQIPVAKTGTIQLLKAAAVTILIFLGLVIELAKLPLKILDMAIIKALVFIAR